MSQLPNILQYSFCLGKDQQLSTLQGAMNGVSGVFGTESENNDKASPLQVLTSMTESLAKVVSHALGMNQIGTESLKQLGIEYLSHEVINLQMALYNFSKQFQANQVEFINARAQQCQWINKIREFVQCEGLKQQISKLLGDIEEIRFGSQFKLEFPHVYLETSTVFYNKLKDITELIDLINKESQLIAKQLYLSLLKPNPTLGELFRFYIIYGIQKHQYQRLITYSQSINKEEIIKELQVISRVFPNLKYHMQQMEQIILKQGQIEINYNQEDLEILMLIKDKFINTVKQIPENLALTDKFQGLLFFTVHLLSQKNQEHLILPQIEAILKSDEIRKLSWLFSLIAQSIYSTRVRLLLWSYQENIIDQRFATFQQTFISDIQTLVQLANNQYNGVFPKPEKISRRQQIQYQDFIDILHIAAQYDILLEEKQDTRNKQSQLEQQIMESLTINDLIIQKEPSSLLIRNQLKQYVDILFQTTPLQPETFDKLYPYYEQNLVNKQQSLIMVRQQLPQQKSTVLDNQKKSQRFLEVQQAILTSDSVIINQQQDIYPPNFCHCLTIFEKSKQKWAGQSLSRVLQEAQGKYQNQLPLELQNDFVSLLKAIKLYNEDQKEAFKIKLKQLYRKEFQKPIKELAETKQKNILQALDIIKEIEQNI